MMRLILYLAIGAMAFIWLVKAPILSGYLTDKLRTPVFMEWVSVWPTETTIRDLKIQSLESPSFEILVKRTQIDYRLKTLFADPSIIDQIHCDTVLLHSECREDVENHTRSALIRKLTLTNVDIEIQDQRRHVDRLELEDVPSDQLIHRVFQEISIEAR